jgi:hypothetical protein
MRQHYRRWRATSWRPVWATGTARPERSYTRGASPYASAQRLTGAGSADPQAMPERSFNLIGERVSFARDRTCQVVRKRHFRLVSNPDPR